MHYTKYTPAFSSQGSYVDGFKMGNLVPGILAGLIRTPLSSYEGCEGVLLSTPLPAGSQFFINKDTGIAMFGDLSFEWDVTKDEAVLIGESSFTPFTTLVPYSSWGYPTNGWVAGSSASMAGSSLFRSFNPAGLATENAIATTIQLMILFLHKKL